MIKEKTNGNKNSGWKSFFRTFCATILALLFVNFLVISMFSGMITDMTKSLGKPMVAAIPKGAVLKIDMSEILLNEQTLEFNPETFINNTGVDIKTLGTWDIVNAIKCAAYDDRIQMIYIRPDAVHGGLSQVEEIRRSLGEFRKISDKPIVSYMENPSNGGYYLASVSDKVYMTPYQGGMNTFIGISSQMTFLKDALDKLGINVQLIRHGKYKSAGEMYIRNSSSEENMEQNKAMIQSIWNTWSEQIASSRNMTAENLTALIEGLKLNFPEDFKNNGLVDELLTKEELKAQVAKLSGKEKWSDVKLISLADYSSIMKRIDDNNKTKVAVIYANGQIVDGKADAEVAGERFANMIAKIRNDESIKAVVLRVNSPGGSVLASEKIKGELDLIKGKKPLIASYGDYAASGGYWISNNCDYIYSNATTLTGSIGVFSMIPNVGNAVKEKLHINITPVNSCKHGDMYSLMRPLDKNELSYMQASVEKIYDKFTSTVSMGRGVSQEYVDSIAQGRVWTGAQAKEIKLVDEIGTLDDAINYAALASGEEDTLNNIQVVEYPAQKTTMEVLMTLLNGSNPILDDTILENAENAFYNWKNAQFGKVYAEMPYRFTFW